MIDFGPLYGRHHHQTQLSYSVTPGERDLILSMIDQQDRNLASIPGIDEPGRIDYADPVFASMTASWQHETGQTQRDGDRQSGWHRSPLPGAQNKINSRMQIDPRVTDICSRRNWEFRIKAFEGNLHMFFRGFRAELHLSVIEDAR